jgi:hypothetical protein
MNEEERLQRALEQQAGSLPQELLEKLPAEEADLLSLVSTLAEIRPPARDPQIAAAQRRALLKTARTESGETAKAGQVKNGRFPFRIGFSWPAAALGAIMLVLLVAGVLALGYWLTPEVQVAEEAAAPETAVVTSPTGPGPTADPAEAFIAIEPILAEIDQEVCRGALVARAEIQALLAQNEDVVELETAVNELIVEFGNCPQTQLKNPVSKRKRGKEYA